MESSTTASSKRTHTSCLTCRSNAAVGSAAAASCIKRTADQPLSRESAGANCKSKRCCRMPSAFARSKRNKRAHLCPVRLPPRGRVEVQAVHLHHRLLHLIATTTPTHMRTDTAAGRMGSMQQKGGWAERAFSGVSSRAQASVHYLVPSAESPRAAQARRLGHRRDHGLLVAVLVLPEAPLGLLLVVVLCRANSASVSEQHSCATASLASEATNCRSSSRTSIHNCCRAQRRTSNWNKHPPRCRRARAPNRAPR